jgi:hypothetical protein
MLRTENLFSNMRTRALSVRLIVLVITKGYIGAGHDDFPDGTRLNVIPGCPKPTVFVPEGSDW